MVAQLPKIKGIGKIVAHAANDEATAHIAGYSVEWRSGLKFRNSAETAALCIYVSGRDPRLSGLHLDEAAARKLAADLRAEIAKPGSSVSVNNHSGGNEQIWQRFTDADATILASRILGALT